MADVTEWHALSPEEALGQLSSSAEGLPASDAAARLARHGPNELAAAGGVSALSSSSSS